jgi:hypothetical protein
MATNNMVPYSNPAGNNQTTPGMSQPVSTLAMPGALNPGTVAANPFVPATATSAIPGASTVPTTGLASAASGSTSGALGNQLSDIYGTGVGGGLDALINSIGGVNSATLQDYAKSLVPQEAKAQANLNASLGAGGVGANSSVAALGDANLQAQETGMIAGEEANLLQSGQQLEASLLTGMEPAAAAETAESGWNVFGQVAGAVGNLAGDIGSSGLIPEL